MNEEKAIVEAEIVKGDALAPAFVGLEASSARAVREAFMPALIQIEEWEAQAAGLTVTDKSQTTKMDMARVMRLGLKKARVSVEKKRKELNADALARTKAINCAAGIVEGLIVPLEKHLLEQETFAARAEEAERNALRSARTDALWALGADPAVYADLGAASEEAWTKILDGARAANEARLEEARRAEEVRVEAERIAAEKREAARKEEIRLEAERVERERLVAEENAKLKAEAEQREQELKVERERVEAERKAEREKAAEEARVEREKAQAAAAEKERLAAIERETQEAERERLLAEQRAAEEKRLAAERELAETKARAEQEQIARQEAELARQAAETEARELAALAPDREKLVALGLAVVDLPMPEMATEQGRTALAAIDAMRIEMAAEIAELARALGMEDAS